MLYLVRHGESTWNVEGRLQGQVADVPLTDRGRRQVAEAAVALAELVQPGALLLSSDQARALETACIVAARLGVPVQTTQLLREQGLGRMEGRLARELAAEPLSAAVPEADITEVSWHGSETIEHVWQRAARLARELAPVATSGRDVVLVGHGTFLQVLDAVLDGRTHRQVDWDRMLANGGVEGRAWPRDKWTGDRARDRRTVHEVTASGCSEGRVGNEGVRA